MKNIILLISLATTIISCSQNDEDDPIEETIYGTWKLIETYNGSGANNSQWKTIDDGYIYTFKKDNTFSSNRFNECSEGTFEINDSNLILKFNCIEFNTGIEPSPGVFIENYAFGENYLFLTPTYLNCDEGCSNKFEKIKLNN
ncbi:hypothetical protein [Salegentibacter maritimus]|uniref:hypothetical protein n=1 Tax=Salegentibacter maritimus TaxID=2794347 RepID=UPI0018E4B08C|nr:hypothetical protein [Salegentibacter maritimus]MBI6117261.1 hypothetical protein [Salegentibacter maritimus]